MAINDSSSDVRRPPTVVVTGASSGIGKACALELDRRGWHVYAGVRSEQAARQLSSEASDRLTPLTIDVTDAGQIAAAAETVARGVGDAGLDALINNAGIALSGPVELVPIDAWRRQFEVNVIGHVAVTQAFLPLLRKAPGRVVNISSVNGGLAAPYMAPYSASKFAIEAITDALRIELRGFGIRVAAVEPGPIDTPIWDKSVGVADQMSEDVDPAALALYGDDLNAMRAVVAKSARTASPVQRVVRAVVHALTAERPKTRYFIGMQARMPFKILKMIPDRLRDWLIRKVVGMR
ncbi:MAG: SDR family oxidoreductase [Planctomycetaceae bacterium]|nr:SDR family oxidoreductase [Planctomycetaceae bacterium]